jgi:hypothetical protein
MEKLWQMLHCEVGGRLEFVLPGRLQTKRSCSLNLASPTCAGDKESLAAVFKTGLIISALVMPTREAFSGNDELLRCNLVRDANLIKCEALADGVDVSDAAINSGKCRSPLTVYEYNMRMVKAITGVEASGISDFRRAYKKGEIFSLYVDKGCAVFEYSVTINGSPHLFKAAF